MPALQKGTGEVSRPCSSVFNLRHDHHKKTAGRKQPCPRQPALQFTIDRIQRAIGHIKDLVVRRQRLMLQ